MIATCWIAASLLLAEGLHAAEPVTLSGDRWRLELSRDRGTLDFLVQPQSEEQFVSVLRPGGELPWYGYNEPAGEHQTAQVKPQVTVGRGGAPVSVRCVLDARHSVIHEALYYPLNEGVLVISRFSFETPPPGAAIVRVAPKMDVNVELLSHYAFAGPDGRTHAGAVAGLGERVTYAGAGPWGPGGDQVERLNLQRPYALLYNPEKAVSLGIVFPMAEALWANAHSFLQLWQDGYNFWYTGFLPSMERRREYAFVLYAKQTGSPEAIEADADRVCREVVERIRSGDADAPVLRGMLVARDRFDQEWPALAGKANGAPPTPSAWLAMLMLRSARECVERDPVTATGLLERARRAMEEGSG